MICRPAWNSRKPVTIWLRGSAGTASSPYAEIPAQRCPYGIVWFAPNEVLRHLLSLMVGAVRAADPRSRLPHLSLRSAER